MTCVNYSQVVSRSPKHDKIMVTSASSAVCKWPVVSGSLPGNSMSIVATQRNCIEKVTSSLAHWIDLIYKEEQRKRKFVTFTANSDFCFFLFQVSDFFRDEFFSLTVMYTHLHAHMNYFTSCKLYFNLPKISENYYNLKLEFFNIYNLCIVQFICELCWSSSE